MNLKQMLHVANRNLANCELHSEEMAAWARVSRALDDVLKARVSERTLSYNGGEIGLAEYANSVEYAANLELVD